MFYTFLSRFEKSTSSHTFLANQNDFSRDADQFLCLIFLEYLNTNDKLIDVFVIDLIRTTENWVSPYSDNALNIWLHLFDGGWTKVQMMNITLWNGVKNVVAFFYIQGVPNDNWRICKLNEKYDVIDTYPSIVSGCECVCNPMFLTGFLSVVSQVSYR